MKTRAVEFLEDKYTSMPFKVIHEWETPFGSIGLYQAANHDYYTVVLGVDFFGELSYPLSMYTYALTITQAIALVAGAKKVVENGNPK